MTRYQFFMRSTLWVKIDILLNITYVPAIIIHELLHLIAILVLWLHHTRIEEIKVHYFFTVVGEKIYDGHTEWDMKYPCISVVHLYIEGTWSRIRSTIVSLAPAIAPVYLLYNYFDNYFVIAWVIHSLFNGFLPSAPDFACVADNISVIFNGPLKEE